MLHETNDQTVKKNYGRVDHFVKYFRISRNVKKIFHKMTMTYLLVISVSL